MKHTVAGIVGFFLLSLASGARGDEPQRALAGDQVQAYGIYAYELVVAGNAGIEIRLVGEDGGEVGRLVTDPLYLRSRIQVMGSPVVELSFSSGSFTVRADASYQASLTTTPIRTLVSQFSSDQIRGVLEISSQVLTDSSLKEMVAMVSQVSRPQGAIDCIFSCIACMLSIDDADDESCINCGLCLEPDSP